MESAFRYNQSSDRTVTRRSGIQVLLLIIGLMFFTLLGTSRVQAATNGFRVVNGVGYYYKNGSRVTGWQTINKRKYYFDSKGRQLVGWQKDAKGNNVRFFYNHPGARGYMVTGFMLTGKKNLRYFHPSTGKMYTGWKKIDGRYRYFSPKSGIAYLGLKKVGGKYYYFSGSTNRNFMAARYVLGFLNVSGSRYYFNRKDGHAQTGWLALNGKNYYFSSEGKLYRNTSFTVDGVTYQADKDGVVTSNSGSAIPTPTSTPTKYNVTNNKTYGVAHDPNGKNYYVAKEFFTHPGVANGAKSDRDLLAAILECEAGDQGLIGMEAVGLCLLNRTIQARKEFPSEFRYTLYQIQFPTSYPQYSPVRDGSLIKRLNGTFYNKTLAYQAADETLKIFNNYVKNKTPRTLKGFDRKDFNFLYFMMESAFWRQNLNFDKVDYFKYKDHMFFVDWV